MKAGNVCFQMCFTLLHFVFTSHLSVEAGNVCVFDFSPVCVY